MNRSKTLSAVLLCLLGTQLALAAAKSPKDRAGLVIFQDENPQDLSRTKILKVTVVQELSDAVILDVEYNRASDLEGKLSLSVMPDMSDWSMTLVYPLPGKIHGPGVQSDRAVRKGMEATPAMTGGSEKQKMLAGELYRATDPETRRSGLESALPIWVGDNVWIGGGAILCPGVTIGANTVVGAGSVVTRDLPADAVAVGNPCRVVRSV